MTDEEYRKIGRDTLAMFRNQDRKRIEQPQPEGSMDATPIDGKTYEGQYEVTHCHDRTEEVTSGDIEANTNVDEDAVELALSFKPTGEGPFIFYESVQVSLSAREARDLAYQLLLSANQIVPEE